MTIWIIILLVFGLLALLARYFILKMYEIKPNRHTDTPEKLGFKFEEVHFPTEHNKNLYGWWVPATEQSQEAPTLVLVHGWSRNLGRMLRYIQHLHPLNYNLLAFDARHHGSSDQDDHSSMYKFGEDIKAAVQYALSRDIDKSKIGAIGLSVGGAGSIYAAAIEPSIKAVVTVGAPAHPVDVMKYEFKKYHLPAPIGWFILKQLETKIGVKYDEFAPVKNIAKSNASFLVIHGEDDIIVPPIQGKYLSEAARPNQCDYWPIAGRGHSNCHHEPGFWERVDTFFQAQFSKE